MRLFVVIILYYTALEPGGKWSQADTLPCIVVHRRGVEGRSAAGRIRGKKARGSGRHSDKISHLSTSEEGVSRVSPECL